MDPNPHGSAFIHEQKCKEIANNGKVINLFKSKFTQAPLFLLLSNLLLFYVCYNDRKLLIGWFNTNFVKGTVQRDFRPPVFFHHSNWPGPLTNGLK